jgi:ATP-dependent Clp protease ATP-binding subunit ClpA
VLLFLGPTGVAKIEVARSLATFLFGSAFEMIRLDMSEHVEEHSTAKVIGSPPGHVRHEEEGHSIRQLRMHANEVVLLDQVSEAHPRIFRSFPAGL